MELPTLLIIILVCIAAEGFFSGSEMAIVKCDKLKLQARAQKGSQGAGIAMRLISQPTHFFATTLLGTNLSTVIASVCTTFYIFDHWGESYTIFALLLTPFLLIFGEMVPKSLYHHFADQLVHRIAWGLKIFGFAFAPVILILSKFTQRLMQQVVLKKTQEAPIGREELRALLQEGSVAVNITERAMMARILELAERRVRQSRVPLVDVVALPVVASREEAFRAFEQKGHSKIPVYQGRIDNIVGILHNSDILLAPEKDSIKDLLRPAVYVPEQMPLDELLIMMKKRREPIVVVVNEFGGVTGIMTVEDLVEEVVGEIHDEYDFIEPLYYRIGKHRYLASGRLGLPEANERLHLNLPRGDYGTIAGFLMHQMGKIPAVGEIYPFGQAQFTITRANERQIQEVEISLR